MTITLSNTTRYHKLVRTTPLFVPQPGYYSRVPMLNDLRQLQPDPSDLPDASVPPGYNKNTMTWGIDIVNSVQQFVGAAFNPDYSTYGALMYGAGGGATWFGSQMHLFDFTTQMWEIVVQPSPWGMAPDYNSQLTVNLRTDFMDWPDNGPYTGHNYTSAQYMPHSWGVTPGTKGAFVKLPGSRANMHFYAHRVDLSPPPGTPRAWVRHSNTYMTHTGLELYAAGTRDDKRQLFYTTAASQAGGNYHYSIDKNGNMAQLNGGIGVDGAVTCWGYAPDPYDVVVSIGNNTTRPPGIKVRRPDAWSATQTMVFTGNRPTYTGDNGMHPEWDPHRGCFLFWNTNSEVITKLFPPPNQPNPGNSDPVTGTWAFVDETLQKTTFDAAYTPHSYGPIGGGQWSKVRYCPAFKCLAETYTVPTTQGPAGFYEVRLMRPIGA